MSRVPSRRLRCCALSASDESTLLQKPKTLEINRSIVPLSGQPDNRATRLASVQASACQPHSDHSSSSEAAPAPPHRPTSSQRPSHETWPRLLPEGLHSSGCPPSNRGVVCRMAASEMQRAGGRDFCGSSHHRPGWKCGGQAGSRFQSNNFSHLLRLGVPCVGFCREVLVPLLEDGTEACPEDGGRLPVIEPHSSRPEFSYSSQSLPPTHTQQPHLLTPTPIPHRVQQTALSNRVEC